MKKLLFSVVALIMLASCQEKKKDDSEIVIEAKPAPSKMIAVSDENMPGKALIDASDCASCHKPNQYFIGPSYLEISLKYSDEDLSFLTDKIMDGGSGSWSDVPMQPHPNLTREQAEQMAQYILSFREVK